MTAAVNNVVPAWINPQGNTAYKGRTKRPPFRGAPNAYPQSHGGISVEKLFVKVHRSRSLGVVVGGHAS